MSGLLARIATRALLGARADVAGVRPVTAPVFLRDDSESPGAELSPPDPDPPHISRSDKHRANTGGADPAVVAPVSQTRIDADSAHTQPVRERRVIEDVATHPGPDAKSRPEKLASWLAGPMTQKALRPAPGDAGPVADRSRAKPESGHRVDDTRPVRPQVAPQSVVPAPVAAAIRPRPGNDSPARPPQTPPAVHVTIGVVEVHANAVASPPPASPPRRRPHNTPALSVDDYLTERREGRR